MRPGQIMFTYFHFAADRQLTQAVLETGATAVAYETLADDQGRLPDAAEAARPEAFNLLRIYAALADKSLVETLAEFEGSQFSHFKAVLTDLAVATLGPVGAEMKRLMADPAPVDGVLAEGAAQARAIAEPILAEVRDIVGFLQPKRSG